MRPIDADLMKAEVESLDAESNNRIYQCAMEAMLGFFVELIDKQPTIEQEVRHGQWSEMYCYIEHGIEMADYECTNCGGEIAKQRGDTPKYCEHCGAEMRDGGAENA